MAKVIGPRYSHSEAGDKWKLGVHAGVLCIPATGRDTVAESASECTRSHGLAARADLDIQIEWLPERFSNTG